MGAAVSLFNPDESPRVPSVDELYCQEIEPGIRKPNTRKNYRQAIDCFIGFLAACGTTGSSPANPAPAGDWWEAATIRAWQEARTRDGLSPSTINTRTKCLLRLIRRLGPSTERNAAGLGLIDRLPVIDLVAEPQPRRRIVSLESIGAVYLHGPAAIDWPAEYVVRRWRALLVLLYNLAMRKHDAMTLTWDAIHFQPESLDPESDARSPHGWCCWVPEKTATKKPHPLTLPLSKTAAEHLRALHEVRGSSRYVFGREIAKELNDSRLYGRKGRPGIWHVMQAAAAREFADHQRFDIKTIRATARTEFNRIQRGIADQVLGHARRGTGDLFYQNWERDLIDAVAKLPQPKAFENGIGCELLQGNLF